METTFAYTVGHYYIIVLAIAYFGVCDFFFLIKALMLLLHILHINKYVTYFTVYM